MSTPSFLNERASGEFALHRSLIEEKWPDLHVEERLGKGGFGTVYRCVKRAEGSEKAAYQRAVKVIDLYQEGDEQEIRRSGQSPKDYYAARERSCREEIDSMEKLKSPYIVQIKNFARVNKAGHPSCFFLIEMPLYQSLEDYMIDHLTGAHNRAQAEALAKQLGLDICDALESCRAAGKVHQDIKPDNIFTPDGRHFYLGDFGLARNINTSIRVTVGGSSGYMPPEAHFSAKPDHRGDLYSLGLVLYQVLNHGRLPFCPPYTESCDRRDEEEASCCLMDPSLDRPAPDGCSPAFAQVVLKAFRYDINDRYQTAAELAQALQSLTPGQKAPAGTPLRSTSAKQTPPVSQKKPAAAPTPKPPVSAPRQSAPKQSTSRQSVPKQSAPRLYTFRPAQTPAAPPVPPPGPASSTPRRSAPRPYVPRLAQTPAAPPPRPAPYHPPVQEEPAVQNEDPKRSRRRPIVLAAVVVLAIYCLTRIAGFLIAWQAEDHDLPGIFGFVQELVQKSDTKEPSDGSVSLLDLEPVENGGAEVQEQVVNSLGHTLDRALVLDSWGGSAYVRYNVEEYDRLTGVFSCPDEGVGDMDQCLLTIYLDDDAGNPLVEAGIFRSTSETPFDLDISGAQSVTFQIDPAGGGFITTNRAALSDCRLYKGQAPAASSAPEAGKEETESVPSEEDLTSLHIVQNNGAEVRRDVMNSLGQTYDKAVFLDAWGESAYVRYYVEDYDRISGTYSCPDSYGDAEQCRLIIYLDQNIDNPVIEDYIFRSTTETPFELDLNGAQFITFRLYPAEGGRITSASALLTGQVVKE